MQFTFDNTPNELEYGRTYIIRASPKEQADKISVLLSKVSDPTDKGVAVEYWIENGYIVTFKIPEKWKFWAVRRFKPGLYRISIRVFQHDEAGSETSYTMNLS